LSYSDKKHYSSKFILIFQRKWIAT